MVNKPSARPCFARGGGLCPLSGFNKFFLHFQAWILLMNVCLNYISYFLMRCSGPLAPRFVLPYDCYCIFHVTLQWSRSQHVSQPIFEVSLLAQNFIDSSETLYIVTYIYYLGAPSTGNSNFFFLILRFFTHNQIYSAESNASCMSLNMFYGPKKFICTL